MVDFIDRNEKKPYCRWLKYSNTDVSSYNFKTKSVGVDYRISPMCKYLNSYPQGIFNFIDSDYYTSVSLNISVPEI